jgi:hypothetical protein
MTSIPIHDHPVVSHEDWIAAQGPAREGEGLHQGQGRDDPGPPGPSVGAGGEDPPVRRAGRERLLKMTSRNTTPAVCS